jgi:MAF protein
MSAPTVILASTSRYRRALLSQLGLPYEAHAPDVDEAPFHALRLPAQETAEMLAIRKAQSLAGQFPEALIIGSDQVAELEGEILHKPVEKEKAVAQLQKMAGRVLSLWTAVALYDGRAQSTHHLCSLHRLHTRPLGEAQIRAYVERDEPLDCAGSFRLESQGIALFERIEGDDYTAIIGLPLIAVVTLLARCGVHYPYSSPS